MNKEEQKIHNKRFYVIQAIRFLAFLMIFLQHTTEYHSFKYYSAGLAVSFFIILSGFLNGYKYSNKYSNVKIKDIKDFTKKRISKIYGLHIVMLLLSRTFTRIFTMTGKENVMEWIKKLFLNIFLLQSYVDDKFVYFSFNGVSWFLAVIVLTAILTIPFLNIINKILDRKNGKKKLLLVTVAILIIDIMYSYIVSRMKVNEEFWLYIFPMARLPEYFIGLVLGISYLDKSEKNSTSYNCLEIITIMILACVIVLQRKNLIPSWIGWGLLWIIPNILVIAVFSHEKGIISKLLGNKLFIWLGNISMETYIIHQVLIINMSGIIGKINQPVMKYMVLIFLFIMTIVISNFIHKVMINTKDYPKKEKLLN